MLRHALSLTTIVPEQEHRTAFVDCDASLAKKKHILQGFYQNVAIDGLGWDPMEGDDEQGGEPCLTSTWAFYRLDIADFNGRFGAFTP